MCVKGYIRNGIESLKSLSSFLNDCIFEIEQVDRLSHEQMKLIWVLCTELGDLIGYDTEEMREALQSEFCQKREIAWFSISPYKKDCATSEIATEFIQFIIEWAVINGYNILIPEGNGDKKKLKHVREVVPEIRRYILACMLNRTCCICGKREEIQLHHIPSVATIGGYENCNGLKTGFLPLCSYHHSEAHNVSKSDFNGKYHINEIWLTENIVRELKPKYPWYFQAAKNINEEKGE